MTACAAMIEALLAPGPWVLGERYSVADGYLFTLTGWLEPDGVDLSRFPRLTAHHARMARRPAVQRALAGESG
jgi:glutathione S-transferase